MHIYCQNSHLLFCTDFHNERMFVIIVSYLIVINFFQHLWGYICMKCIQQVTLYRKLNLETQKRIKLNVKLYE